MRSASTVASQPEHGSFTPVPAVRGRRVGLLDQRRSRRLVRRRVTAARGRTRKRDGDAGDLLRTSAFTVVLAVRLGSPLAVSSSRSWRDPDADPPPVGTCFAVGGGTSRVRDVRCLLDHQSVGITLVLLLRVRAGASSVGECFSTPRRSRSSLNLRGGSVDSLRSVMSGPLDGRCLCGRLNYRRDD